jgi:uncharacterized protein YoxC
MESILNSEIFFFITSICVIFVTLAILVLLIYFIKIIHNFYKISNILKKYTKETETELNELAGHIRKSPLFTFIFGKEKKKK